MELKEYTSNGNEIAISEVIYHYSFDSSDTKDSLELTIVTSIGTSYEEDLFEHQNAWTWNWKNIDYFLIGV